MSSLSSVMAPVAFPRGIDELGLESSVRLVTGATAGPETGVSNSGLGGGSSLNKASSGGAVGSRCPVFVDVVVWAGASVWTCVVSEAADCAMICCGRGVLLIIRARQ